MFTLPDFTHVLQFSGTWYYTDKYPDEWEVTTCPGITFTKSDIENRTDIQEWHAKNITDVEVDRRTDGYLNRTVLADNAARFTRNLTLRNSEENVQASKKISFNTSISSISECVANTRLTHTIIE